MKKFFFAIILIAAVAAIIIYRLPTTNNYDQPIVATTIFPVYDLVSNIAGDKIEVIQIMPAGANPHTFEPTPSLIKKVTGADVFFKIGYGLDDWVDTIASQANTNESIATGSAVTTIQRLDDGLKLRETDDAIDPHYWLAIPNAKQMARNIEATLSTTYPQYSVEFKNNLEAYLLELDSTDKQIRTTLESVANKNLVTMHDAWYYFSDEYGLTIAGTFEPASGKEPTPQFLSELLTAVEKYDVQTIYSEPQTPEATIESFAADNNLKIAQLDDIGGVAGRASYLELMNYNAQVIAQNQ